MSIRILPVHLVNKIAAGEVIERPASLVKELIENSLDAGAGRIDVTVEDGGRKLVAVADDGCGMGPEDLALAFAPHATSKIASDEDLFRIETMGFRGEALASIAAVSHAHIRTRRRDDPGGWEAEASGESAGSVRPCAAGPGTTVTVRDLFFNTPARRKFLRTANTEFGHVAEQLARLALPHPRVAFTLAHNGRTAQNLPAADSTRRRATDLFGDDLGNSLLPIRPRTGRVSVSGLIAPPAAARASGAWQYFFLNGRYVRDRVLSHALREAYRGRIEPSRWPVAFVFLQVAPDEVDVNVHPTKIEVRFRDSQLVHGEVLAALRETLNQADLAPDASLEAAVGPPGETADLSETADEKTDMDSRRESLRQALADFFKSAPSPQPHLGFPPPHPRRGEEPAAKSRSEPPQPIPIDSADRYVGGGSVSSETTKSPDLPVPARPAGLAASESPPPPPGAAAIQVHNSYIVAGDADGLIIIDQHALHERILYNDLKRRLTEGPLAGQRMLIPETFQAGPSESAALAARRDLLARLGIEADPFGPGVLAVQTFPSLLAERGVRAGPFVREILDRLADDETADGERLLEDVLEMMACKAAVKAGDPLSGQEIRALLARRDETEKSSACPHGRPTTLKLSLRELEKQFRRT